MDRIELLNIIKKLQPGLASKGIVDGMDRIHFCDENLIAYNGIICVSHPISVGVSGISVNAAELYALLCNNSSDEVGLSVCSNELLLEASGMRAGLRALALGAIKVPSCVDCSFSPLPPQFQASIDLCSFSIGNDMTRPHLTCVHLSEKKVVSSDNQRITEVVMGEPVPFSFLLPKEAVVAMSSYAFTHITMDDSWLYFAEEDSGLLFSVRKRVGNLLDVSSFFAVDGVVVELPAELKSIVEQAKIMTEGASLLDLAIEIRVEAGKLYCRGSKESGWVEESIDVSYAGERITFKINPLFLLDVLSRTTSMTVSDRVCLITGSDFKHVILLSKK